jgi:hypothetical protein
MTQFAGWNQRIGERYDLDGGIPAMLTSARGKPVLSRIVNLSVSGAGVVVPDESAAEVDDQFELTVGDSSTPVLVREIRELGASSTYYGVEFLNPAPSELMDVLNEVIDAQDPGELEARWNRSA